MNNTHKKLILFGDSCTEVNEPIAMTAKYWDVIQVGNVKLIELLASL